MTFASCGKNRAVLFGDEAAMQTDLTRKIDAWWAEFTARTGVLRDVFARRRKWDLPSWMQKHLQAINEYLMWEFGPAIHGNGHRLVITPEWRRHLRPLVRQILAKAPRLDGWEFYAYRLPEDFDMAEQTVKARTGGSIARTLFRASVNEINKINLLFLSRDYGSADNQQARNDVFVATETLLGEEVLDRWIGAIDVAPLDHGREEPQGIRDLKTGVDRLIEEVKSSLLDVPCFQVAENMTWTARQSTPDEADDYPGQSDLVVGIAMLDPMWLNAHRNESFDSVRFSRHGETFCYVKIDGLEGSRFGDKSEIVNAVDEALTAAEVGCYVGGGTGLRYIYFDLALIDVGRGVEIVRRILRDGKISRRSWILYFDTDLQTEWIGIWDDAPPPPTAEFEE